MNAAEDSSSVGDDLTLIFPVVDTWGPMHRSMSGPHLYTVVLLPSGTFLVMRLTWMEQREEGAEGRG